MIDDLERTDCSDSRRSCKSSGANHPMSPLLQTAPGIGWVLGYTIAAEIGDIERFATPVKLTG